MFESTADQLLTYLRSRPSQPAGGEVLRRLRQLDYCLARVEAFELPPPYVPKRPIAKPLTPEVRAAAEADMLATQRVIEEAALFAEAFYAFAWRIRGAVRHMPGMRKFDAPGVRMVRNILFEHLEGKGGNGPRRNSLESFDIGGGDVYLRIGWHVDEGDEETREATMAAYSDKGLRANAEEFRTNLESALTLATIVGAG